MSSGSFNAFIYTCESFTQAMHKGFEKILVLIDYSTAAIHAAEEASELAARFGSELHLLHIINSAPTVYTFLSGGHYYNEESTSKDSNAGDSFSLNSLQNKLIEKYSLVVKATEEKGNLSDVIRNYVIKENISLVVVAGRKQSHLREFIFRSLAEQVVHLINCEVLCIYPESDFSKIKMLVIPVGGSIPKRKIRIAYELAKKFAANIHLIALARNANGLKTEELKILMDTYRYIKDITNIPVQCSTVIGNSIAEAAMRYAKNIKADLILVNHESESKMKDTLLPRWRSDIVNHSTIPVLSVHPVMEQTGRNGFQAM